MLSKSYLVGNSIYVCTEYNDDVLERYFEIVDSIFNLIAKCEKGYNLKKLIKRQNLSRWI